MLLALLLSLPAWADSARFSLVTFPGETGTLQAGIWYPSGPARRSLIVIVHGAGGDYKSHSDTAIALAGAGFIAAAITLPPSHWSGRAHPIRVSERPRAIHALIHYLQTGWKGRAALKPDSAGIYGYSTGGFAALVTIGGVPDFSRIGPYCENHPAIFICDKLKALGLDAAQLPPPEPVTPEPSIKAAVIAAPALGFTFTRAGLANVRIPVQLWRAGQDQVLPSPDYAEPVRDNLPLPPEYHVAANASHFDFLPPCKPALAEAAALICTEQNGFDRAAFHRSFNQALVDFFRRNLGR